MDSPFKKPASINDAPGVLNYERKFFLYIPLSIHLFILDFGLKIWEACSKLQTPAQGYQII